MANREDGKETRKRILDAACEIFADKGYHAAKVAEICRRAGANVASVNYYFGDKATLYLEVWKESFKRCVVSHVPDSQAQSPEEQLRAYIHSLIRDFADKGDRGQFTRLYLTELAHPTGLIHDLWHDLIQPRRLVLLDIIRKIAGQNVPEEAILFCEMSVISQCRTLLTVRRNDLEYLLGQPLSTDLIGRLADHITRFSLAGIRAIGEQAVRKDTAC